MGDKHGIQERGHTKAPEFFSENGERKQKHEKKPDSRAEKQGSKDIGKPPEVKDEW